ncbi:MAG: 2-C-methyl-D-erythritol 4-phosphate cytidylyltransferase [Chloroflexi bacterium]|nr:2-C-methyl-D-erythritol 4-phosphate cytidylyltransferase [Chloroflexota bacterium]
MAVGARVGAIVVAAGAGTRMGVDKMFINLGGKPLIAYAVDALQASRYVHEIVLVLSEANLERGSSLARDFAWTKLTSVCAGGARRQDSVQNGLAGLEGCEWVIIHDGARPFLEDRLIEEGLAEAEAIGAAVPAVPVKDTIKVVDQRGLVRSTPSRVDMWAAQTPQVFRYELIVEAYRNVTQEVTDDAQAVELMGHPVKVFLGSYENLKVTTPEDVEVAEGILRRRARGAKPRRHGPRRTPVLRRGTEGRRGDVTTEHTEGTERYGGDATTEARRGAGV